MCSPVRQRKKMTSCHTKVLKLTSPIGEMVMIICPRGLHSLNQIDNISDENFDPNRCGKVMLLDSVPEHKDIRKHALECVEWLETYFHDIHSSSPASIVNICVASETGTFRERVWLALAKNVGPGQTISYGELAKLVTKPGAAQAVGTAMATNPIQIMVPCHRVIRSDGSMGLYSRGKKNKVKAWLLNHEGVDVKMIPAIKSNEK